MGKLTVGDLRAFLEKVDPDMEITFGSSRHSRRPLIFGKFRPWSDHELLIELEEIGEHHEAVTEQDSRSREFLERLRYRSDSDIVSFSDTIDAVPIAFKSISLLVGINLEQPGEPKWFVDGS